MSLINDALKQARQNPPRHPSRPGSPLPPVPEPESRRAWLVPAILISLVFIVVFLIGWATAHHSVRKAEAAAMAVTEAALATQAVSEASAPIIELAPPAQNSEDTPRLQGIFFSANPTAILDGKTVRPGDHYLKYRVTEITKFTVTLVGPDGKPFKLGMAN